MVKLFHSQNLALSSSSASLKSTYSNSLEYINNNNNNHMKCDAANLAKKTAKTFSATSSLSSTTTTSMSSLSSLSSLSSSSLSSPSLSNNENKYLSTQLIGSLALHKSILIGLDEFSSSLLSFSKQVQAHVQTRIQTSLTPTNMNQSSSHSNPNDNSNSHNSNNNNKNKNINKNNKNNNTGSSLIAENITKLHSWFAFFQLVLNCRFEIQETILLPRLVQKTTLHREFFADRSKLNSVITQMADALNELHYHGLSLQRLSHALWLNSKLVDVLQSYLQTERDLLCPLLETHFSESEFMEIENLIAFSGGKDKLAVILPFVTHCLSKEDEYKLLKELKLSKLHRLMYRKVWKPAYYNTTGSLLFQVTESSCQLSQSNPSTDFWLTRGAASFIH